MLPPEGILIHGQLLYMSGQGVLIVNNLLVRKWILWTLDGL
jgi:hypothetical protein